MSGCFKVCMNRALCQYEYCKYWFHADFKLVNIYGRDVFNPFNPTIVTVKTVFIYKALKTLLTGVLVTPCKYGKNKGSQLNMCRVT